MSLLEAVVDIVWPSIVISSITIDCKPSIVVVVAPKVNTELPKVVVGFAKLAFVIPAVPDKFEFVILVASICTWLSETVVVIPEPAAKVNVSFVL